MSTVIIPVQLESFFGEEATLEVYPSGEMWIAVHVVDGKVIQELTDFGYKSLEELKNTYKDMEVMDVKENKWERVIPNGCDRNE